MKSAQGNNKLSFKGVLKITSGKVLEKLFIKMAWYMKASSRIIKGMDKES